MSVSPLRPPDAVPVVAPVTAPDTAPDTALPAAGRVTLVCAALFGALAVAMGAFGAHALQDRLSASALGWYDTAATYHATHALALFGCGLLAGQPGQPGGRSGARLLRVAALCLATGTVLFAGSLYLMAFTGWTRLGIVTPVGGLALIVGWLAMALASWRRRQAY